MRLRHRFLQASLCLAALTAFESSAQAAPLLGASVFVQSTGEVRARFLGHTAAYSNDLYLDSPANSLGIIFNNHATPLGTEVSLGSFTAGTELIFRIHVNNTGHDFYTGPGSRNPDGIPHAVVDDAYSPGYTFVSFEDLFGGGDRDYDDLKFAFTNVASISPPPIPEPASLLLLTGGLAGLAASRRLGGRRRARSRG